MKLQVAQAAEVSGVPESTLRRWAANGKISAEKGGGKMWLIEMDSVPLDSEGLGRLRHLGSPRSTLRERVEALIRQYRDDNNSIWIGQVPYLIRTTVVDELEEALDG